MNIDWKFTNFCVYESYQNHANVVYQYQFELSVTDGESVATHNGFVRLNFDNLTEIIPFDSVTKQNVIDWTVNHLGFGYELLLMNLKESLIAKNSQTIQSLPAPWEQS